MKERLVILGGGFGSFRLAMQISTERYEVTVISPRNHFLFTPLLASTTVGTVEFRSIIEPLRLAQSSICYYRASCIAIDPLTKTVACSPVESDQSFDLTYDLLVIGVGATSNTFGIPGVEQYAIFLKELSDARLLRQRIISSLELASLPSTSPEQRERLLHFVIVGGGPTGVEFAAELHDFVHDDLSRSFPIIRGNLKIAILEAGEQLLSTFDRSLSNYTMTYFHQRKIEVRVHSRVKEIRPEQVVLQDNTLVPFGVLVWSAGIKAVELVRNLSFEKDAHSRILTDHHLKVLGQECIYAIGDCASIQGMSLPATAQLAQQQGKYLAHRFNKRDFGADSKPFKYFDLGMLAYIGEHRALADLPHLKGRGFMAWLLWRSIYITKLVSLRNKLRVLFDWFRTRIFGRDISSF